MVHVNLKEMSCDECDHETFYPADPTCFHLNLRLRIGLADSPGADDFEVCVCTPEWLKQVVLEPRWGRHLMIVREYNLSAIKEQIHKYVAQADGDDWNAIATKLARVFAWEFEDYQS